MQDQRNFFLAIVLSLLVVVGYSYLQPKHTVNPPPPAPTSPAQPVISQSPAAQAQRGEVLAEAPRIKIETPKLHGSLSLAGARIDDLVLANYYETIKREKLVTLLSPAGSVEPFYVEFGWTADGNVPVPTSWYSDGTVRRIVAVPYSPPGDCGYQ